MSVSNWMLIAATIAGPILAVRAQKWVERATESLSSVTAYGSFLLCPTFV